jgi:hypothetical protein
MAPKAVDARRLFDRNDRFRGHGPLLHVVHQTAVIEATVSCRGGPRPRKWWMHGDSSTGTIAFAGMARSHMSCIKPR